MLQNIRILGGDSNQVAELKILKGKDALCVCVTEGREDSKYVVFFVVRIATQMIGDDIIDDAVYTVRENGRLRLLTENNIYIV